MYMDSLPLAIGYIHRKARWTSNALTFKTLIPDLHIKTSLSAWIYHKLEHNFTKNVKVYQ